MHACPTCLTENASAYQHYKDKVKAAKVARMSRKTVGKKPTAKGKKGPSTRPRTAALSHTLFLAEKKRRSMGEGRICDRWKYYIRYMISDMQPRKLENMLVYVGSLLSARDTTRVWAHHPLTFPNLQLSSEESMDGSDDAPWPAHRVVKKVKRPRRPNTE